MSQDGLWLAACQIQQPIKETQWQTAETHLKEEDLEQTQQ